MTDQAQIKQIVDVLRQSEAANGRTYSRTGVDPKWLAKEVSEYCKSQGWANTLSHIVECKAWLVVSDDVAVLVEGTSDVFLVKVQDLNPVHIKTGLALTGLLALTGVGIVALPLAGAGAWRASARKAKVKALVKFADERIQLQGNASQVTSEKMLEPPTVGDVAERLKALASLKELGILTDEEYETKRQQLVKQL